MIYRIIRSNRKTFALEMTREGLLVRVPYTATKDQIDRFVDDHRAWIEKHRQKMEERRPEPADKLSMDEIRALADEALKYIPERVAYYAPIAGVSYGRITIRNQKSRWGSCSAKGNLNFNCLLMLCPEAVRDYVVVHELCHRIEMNHSDRFWQEVGRVFPDYRNARKWLRTEGKKLIAGLDD